LGPLLQEQSPAAGAAGPTSMSEGCGACREEQQHVHSCPAQQHGALIACAPAGCRQFARIASAAASTMIWILRLFIVLFDIGIFLVYLSSIPYGGMVCQGRKGEICMINQAVKKEALTRLRRIEGQVRGIMKMVEDEKYCIDIINQITAAEKALSGVARIVMKRHVESCVSSAIVQGKGQKMIDELIDAVFKILNRK
jgi:DNA-binding FrmR family transcriptional regulator